MDKVNLNSTRPSYLIGKQSPRSLTYYLSAGLHHKIVGRFVTLVFFSGHAENLENTNANQSNDRTKSESPTKKTDNSEHENKKSRSTTDKSKIKKKQNTERVATAGLYSNVTDPGPFANYEQTYKDSSLVREKVKLSKEILAVARTVFPIDPFPDTIILDRTTLNITKRTFFFSNDTLSIRIEDILNAKVNLGPFFGSLTIASRVLSSEDHFTISNLWRKDAIHLKHMIQGYIIALHNEIEISHLSKEELTETITELGHDQNNK